MSLTLKQKKTIQSHLQRKISGPCPMCAETSWSLEDGFVTPSPIKLNGEAAADGEYIPMVQLICAHCGFVSHHAVQALGIKL